MQYKKEYLHHIEPGTVDESEKIKRYRELEQLQKNIVSDVLSHLWIRYVDDSIDKEKKIIYSTVIELLKNSYDWIIEKFNQQDDLFTWFIKTRLIISDTKTMVRIMVMDNGAWVVKDKKSSHQYMATIEEGEIYWNQWAWEMVLRGSWEKYIRKFTDNWSVATIDIDTKKLLRPIQIASKDE